MRERQGELKETFSVFEDAIRLVVLIFILIVSLVFGVLRLMKVQLVDGESYQLKASTTNIYTQHVSAARGEIVDSEGRVIVGNKIGYNVIIEKAYFPTDKAAGNQVIYDVVSILREAGAEWNDTLPVSLSEPYTFSPEAGEEYCAKVREILNLNTYATAENCVDKLISDYEISDAYPRDVQRVIAGIRYEMLIRSFSVNNHFTLAEDIPLELVTKIKELRLTMSGVDVIEEAIRFVEDGNVIPHEIGTVGPIYSIEEYESLKESGYEYLLSDTVGKSGLELALEAELCGERGVKEITYVDGSVISSEITKEAVGGNTVQLTLNSQFQKGLQTTLTDFIGYLHEMPGKDLKDVSAGAIVVLDVDSNAVLGMATAPTYDLNDLMEDYNAVLNAENTPLVNRATDGLYRPGSTFKTITATAGLNTGVVNGNSTFYCGRNYEFIDTTVHCTGHHNDINVTRAITVSCNIYFYELSQRLGIDTLSQYATYYGLGQTLGLESGDSAGYLANPETFEKLGMEWYVGYLLQAAIGQSEVQITPLQMAVAASTIANEGVRYQPHLVDSVYDHAMTTKLSQKEKVVAAEIPITSDSVYANIEQGMIGAAQSTMPEEYSLKNLGFDVAIKTGTPQSPRGTDSFVIGYAPAENPEIAFAAVIEGGEQSKYMVRKILELYAEVYPDTQIGLALSD
ncbi:MAG: hypothetical protein IJY85_05975 [Ruminococcus sp.]|nr:hypothetical protein [Ruminococcus sp.]